MKNKILIGVATLLILLVFIVRHQFKEKFEVFKTSVSLYESAQIENFRKEKENRIAALSNGDKKILQLFTEQFDESKAIIEQDTSFSFLYLSDKVKYKTASLKYIECLYDKCIIDKQNEANRKLITAKENELEKKFGETYSIWFPKLKDEKLLKKTNKSGYCSNYFSDLNEISYDSNVWNDFEKFMIAYNSETRESQIQNKQTENQFASSVAATKNQLRSGVINYFDEKLSARKSQIITTETEQKTFNSPTLGLITYSVNKTSFDEQAFQNVADDAFEEQWKNNSLGTGSMPYSSCYGSSNYCSDWSCSKIKVITGGSGDVLVSVKNSYGKVVRHAYIKGGNSFTFNVPDGSYQVFFYSGIGWNPSKSITSSSCGSLRGGFVSNEGVTKDNYISLYSQIMTYELILQERGNFNTKPSSKSEAF
ncbi:MAG: hypothetical protein IPG60_06440 [Bacteroidetes bacterium]|nr:hypothetical protein [Bacteroidota bacterium]MBP9923484.1 hypothetical protein [Bacteroidia bacterium]